MMARFALFPSCWTTHLCQCSWPTILDLRGLTRRIWYTLPQRFAGSRMTANWRGVFKIGSRVDERDFQVWRSLAVQSLSSLRVWRP